MSNNLNGLLKLLLDHNIDFLLVGGMAAILYGASQITHDVDVCMVVRPDQVETLRRCLAPYHPVHRETPQKFSFLEIPQETSHLKNIYLQTDLGGLDILGEIAGVGNYENVLKNCIAVELYGHRCKLIGLEDLIKTKETLNRDKDKATLRELRVILDRQKNPKN